MSLRTRLYDGLVVEHGRGDGYGRRDRLKQTFALPHQSWISPSRPSGRSLLDLPTEIRLKIYEAIFPPASVVLQSGENIAMIAVVRNFPELISRGSRDVQVFRTCRTCHNEAIPIFYRSLNLLVSQNLQLLRLNFLSCIGPINASFIRCATITPIGLPGEHQRFLECLGPKHGGLVGLEHLTLDIWNSAHIPAFISTCQELIQRHQRLQVLFGRGTDLDGQLQAGDIPAQLRLAMAGQMPGHREHNIDSTVISTTASAPPGRSSINSLSDPKQSRTSITERGDGDAVDAETPLSLTSRGRHPVNFAVPEPKMTIWSRYKLRRQQRAKEKE